MDNPKIDKPTDPHADAQATAHPAKPGPAQQIAVVLPNKENIVEDQSLFLLLCLSLAITKYTCFYNRDSRPRFYFLNIFVCAEL